VNVRCKVISASKLTVTIIDYDLVMRAAIKRVYLDAHSQLCIFHINKNIVLNIKCK
ncbi:hypothetical protein GE21DRAFT_1195848, partial [Neurospora crassa]